MVAGFGYLLSLHIIEMEDHMGSTFQFFYLFDLLNDLVNFGNNIFNLLHTFVFEKICLFHLLYPHRHLLRCFTGYGDLLFQGFEGGDQWWTNKTSCLTSGFSIFCYQREKVASSKFSIGNSFSILCAVVV